MIFKLRSIDKAKHPFKILMGGAKDTNLLGPI